MDQNTVQKADDSVTEITNNTLDYVYDLLRAENIIANDVQKQMLTSHVTAMVMRSITGEALPEVDESLFEEISPESVAMARKVVDRIGNLAPEEAWLLSVHFEVARANEA